MSGGTHCAIETCVAAPRWGSSGVGLELGWRFALMRLSRKHSTSGEPIGIVIADGSVPSTEPRFLAYVWGPVPDLDEESERAEALVAAVA
jgi:hypothetical protein